VSVFKAIPGPGLVLRPSRWGLVRSVLRLEGRGRGSVRPLSPMLGNLGSLAFCIKMRYNMTMKICTRCKGQHATEARTCLACRTQSAAYQRTKRRENPHLCGSCLCRPRLKDKSKCQSCFDSHAQWEINRFRKRRTCGSCSNLVEKSCYKRCESCRERDRERHKIKWIRAFVSGLCRQCGIRTPAQGYVRCAFCLDIAARCAIEIERKRATTPSVP